MEKNEIDKYETLNICFCCKKEKKGTFIDGRFVCHDCNHLPKEK